MIIKNVKLYREDKTFRKGSIVIQNGKFVEVSEEDLEDKKDEEVIDGGNCYALPGLIDLHFHGCVGHDFCDGTKEAIEAIAKYEASVGVTAIAPATMTLPKEELIRILSVAADYKKENVTQEVLDARIY